MEFSQSSSRLTHNIVKNAIFTILISIASACNYSSCRDSGIPVQEVEVIVERLEHELFKANDKAQIIEIFKKNPTFANDFLDADKYPSYDIIADQYLKLLNDPYIDTLYRDTRKEFDNFDNITSELASAFGRIKSTYPDFLVPKIQTTVTGLYKDLFINDSLVIIGVDHFLGQNAKYKPLDVPEYIYRRYDKEHMAAMIVSFIGGKYNKSDFLDNTMLAEMIDYGKVYYFVSQMMPCVSEHLIIGYTEEEWTDAKENDDIIWANFIENELLYDTNHTLKNKFIGERPKVFEIGDKCPGRIGRWVGWKIVEAYMLQHPDLTLNQLMLETDAKKIFQMSKYKPRN